MITVRYDQLGLRAGERMLDLGCGFGRHAYEAMRRGASVVACDLGVAELRQVHAVYAGMLEAGELPDGVTCQSVNGDATSLPFPTDSFDRVLASEVLEHIPDDAAAFAELARVLKPGGTMAVTIPASFAEKVCWKLSDQYHAPAVQGGHVRIYAKREVHDKLRAAGLTPGGDHRAHALHAPYWWLRCAVGPRVPPLTLLGHREGSAQHAPRRSPLEPAHRQEPRRVRDQAACPSGACHAIAERSCPRLTYPASSAPTSSRQRSTRSPRCSCPTA
jgi:SAM-dependent methyltransferase